MIIFIFSEITVIKNENICVKWYNNNKIKKYKCVNDKDKIG